MADTVPEIVDGAAAAAATKAKARKKQMILGAAGAAVLLLGGGASYMMFSGGKSATHAEAGAAESADAGHGGEGGEAGGKYIDVPPMVVNLRSPDGRARFLKVHFMLVPGPKGTETLLKTRMPAILDAYQPFLRELRPEDLAGSAAVFRIKEELLSRANAALGPDVVQDILIQDLVQQ